MPLFHLYQPKIHQRMGHQVSLIYFKDFEQIKKLFLESMYHLIKFLMKLFRQNACIVRGKSCKFNNDWNKTRQKTDINTKPIFLIGYSFKVSYLWKNQNKIRSYQATAMYTYLIKTVK